ncbi:ankyrin repeat domain-containing protein 49-like [Patiria miniata]|uniref:Uncharacterized protein n=1 Tax=Patiria miniata TaxID=46514 RepID=A0A914ADW3_PATMI|nr:ankyrin repeat domain-containing protein 49-like [Patiria miniata]
MHTKIVLCLCLAGDENIIHVDNYSIQIHEKVTHNTLIQLRRRCEDFCTTAAGSNAPCFPLSETQYEYNRSNGRTDKETKYDYRDLFKDPGLQTSADDLFHAAAIGNTTKVQEIISKTPGLVKSQNREGQTPLHAAAYGGHLDTVVALVTNGAPLEQQDKGGYTALTSAVDG